MLERTVGRLHLTKDGERRPEQDRANDTCEARAAPGGYRLKAQESIGRASVPHPR